MHKTYEIRIGEYHSAVVEIRADSATEALEKAKTMHKTGEAKTKLHGESDYEVISVEISCAHDSMSWQEVANNKCEECGETGVNVMNEGEEAEEKNKK